MTGSDNFGSIEHDGIVQKSDKNSVTVRISSVSACSGCHEEGSCTLSGKEDKIIDISGRYNLVPGEAVTVLMKKSMGYAAVILGYVIPMILVVALVIILGSMSLPELITGLGSLAVLIPYYLVLWFFRKRINTNFKFTIKI
ncbi:MAG: SoxR reducing system RseC family protein [Bacteroidales bacterium]|jgi:sigma-E factor negative regulatory protein RseC|nr:SoxR reducing system RseC family protein [Bacteroidales bacterium]